MVSLDRLVGLTLLLACLTKHTVHRRRVFTLEDRLAMLPRKKLPVEKSMVIRWNQHHVPFINAETDHDLAVALGMVHAHLRLGQLELMRRLAQGRVSEMIGSIGVEVDRLLRTLDFGRAVPAILVGMPPATRAWLDAFVRGLNHYLMQAVALPPEFDLFGLRREPWSVTDILTLGRLVSADVNWIVWFQLLKFRGDADWPRLWRKLLEADNLPCWTDHGNADRDGSALLPILGAALRSGSNSFVVASTRSAMRAPLIASDPHLSLILPNPWVLAVIRSPSYHAVGLMIPGLPFIALGRNPWIAWGGTSLHAASSDLVAVPAEALAGIRQREEELSVRWGRSRRVRIRETQWGPVVSDIPLLSASGDTLALRWMGHRPSDEITAMLAVNRARNWTEFRAALDGFAVPGQNMLYADESGRIGRLMAVHLPRRGNIPSDDVAVMPEPTDGWDTPVTSSELPCLIDPSQGFITSANERPQEGSPFIGRHFSPPDRKQRLDALLAAAEQISVETAVQIQCDVHWTTALAQCRQLLAWLDFPAMAHRNARERRFIADLTNWNGGYDRVSRGALAFELLCHHLARILISRRRREAYSVAWGTRRLIWDDVLSADPGRRQRALRLALRNAAKAIGARETWGSRHRLRLGHPLALLPVLGRAWHFTDLPAAGTSDTLMKTAHTLTDRRHGSRYGSVARHISDLSDLDHNYFALLGGQDGWLGSTTFLDQVPLWQRSEYVVLPLRPETARVTFPHCTELAP